MRQAGSMPESAVVILPFDYPDAPALQAELVGRGLPAFLPEIPQIEAEVPDRLADAKRVAYTAIWLNENAVSGPIVCVARGAAARLLPGLGFAQRSAHRLVSAYMIVDGPTPAPAQEWPDAPVWWLLTPDAGAELADQVLTAKLRGFQVVEQADVVSVLADFQSSG